MPEEVPRNEAIESIIEKKMGGYAGSHQVHACPVRGDRLKEPMRPVSQMNVIDCLRALKETLDGLDQWEASQLEKEMAKKIDETRT